MSRFLPRRQIQNINTDGWKVVSFSGSSFDFYFCLFCLVDQIQLCSFLKMSLLMKLIIDQYNTEFPAKDFFARARVGLVEYSTHSIPAPHHNNQPDTRGGGQGKDSPIVGASRLSSIVFRPQTPKNCRERTAEKTREIKACGLKFTSPQTMDACDDVSDFRFHSEFVD